MVFSSRDKIKPSSSSSSSLSDLTSVPFYIVLAYFMIFKKVSRLKSNPKVYEIESKILRAKALNSVLKMLEMFPTEVYAQAIYEMVKISGY